MNNKFLIQSTPNEAAYVDQYQFVECYPTGQKNADGTDQFDIRSLLNALQVVDSRISLEDLQRLETPAPDIASIFEIEDMQLSARGADALCSFALFKGRGLAAQNKAVYGRRWKDYLEGLQRWIHFYRAHFPNQKIRVHVANDMWDELHKEGILQSKDVDFVKMVHSDYGTLVGILWRYLAFDDYNYEYVYAEDIDANGEFRDVAIDRLTRIEGRLSRWAWLKWLEKNSLNGLKNRLQLESGDTAHLSQIVAIRPNEFAYYPVTNDTTVGSEMLFSDGDYNLSPELPFFIHSGHGCILAHDIATFCMSCGHWMARGPRKLPCSIVPLLCRDFMRNPILQAYNLDKHQWSRFYQFERVMQYYGPDDVFPFYLTRILDVKYSFLPNRVDALREMYRFYGEDCFLLRLYKQLSEERTYFSCFLEGDLRTDVPFTFEMLNES